MLYHSDVRSAGFGGITRLGFSRTSRTCQGDGRPQCSEAWRHQGCEVGWESSEHCKLWGGDGGPRARLQAVPCPHPRAWALTSTSVRKWMASGSVTKRFLFSTSFRNLEHL